MGDGTMDAGSGKSIVLWQGPGEVIAKNNRTIRFTTLVDISSAHSLRPLPPLPPPSHVNAVPSQFAVLNFHLSREVKLHPKKHI